jgi:hypothetical protein
MLCRGFATGGIDELRGAIDSADWVGKSLKETCMLGMPGGPPVREPLDGGWAGWSEAVHCS